MATNLSANWPLRFLGEAKTEKFIMDSAAAHIVYQGCPLMIDDNVDTDHLVPSSYITVVQYDCFVGIAAQYKAVVIGSPEDEEHNGIEVYVEPSIVGFKGTTYTAADLGAYVAMDGTGLLSSVGAGKPRIGKLFKVEDGYMYVQLETPWVQAA
jgi:hypothetical protein